MRADAALSPAGHQRPDLEARRKAKARAVRMRRILVAGGAGVVVAAIVGTGVGFAGSSARIADGITIAGVDVSGMTATEARSALEERAAQVARQPVAFTAGGETFSIRARKIGLTTNWDAAIEKALAEGDGFILFRGFERIALRMSGTDVEPVVSTKERPLEKQVERFAAAVDTRPREAAIVLDGLTPRIVPAQTGVDLDRRRAATTIVSALAGFARGQPVPLPTRITQPKVTARDLGPVADRVRTALSGPVDLVFRKTELTITPKRLATFLVLPAGGKTELGIGGASAEKYFGGVQKALDREPQNASFALNANGKIRVVPAEDGRALNVKATERALLAAALAPVDRTGKLVVATDTPRITTEKAKGMGIVGLVGSYTTTYGGEPNRLANVQLVSKLLDDHLIAPGEVFSFNKTTGERNAEKGFLEAPVIINGELQTGIGGGVCQVSTTVFNAAFEAGLSIEERTNHALYISHYPTGRDATVNYPDLDLKFKNDTGHWLWLRTFVGASQLTVNLYGTPVDRRVEFNPGPLEVVGEIPVNEISDPTLFVGEEVVEDSGEPPRAVSVQRVVYGPDGEVMYDTTWQSRYEAEPKIVHVGTKERPAEETPPAQADGADGEAQDEAGAGAGAGAGQDVQPPQGQESDAEQGAPPTTQPDQGEQEEPAGGQQAPAGDPQVPVLGS